VKISKEEDYYEKKSWFLTKRAQIFVCRAALAGGLVMLPVNQAQQ